MLQYKRRIIDHARVAQGKLGRVPRDAAPVTLEPAVDGLLADAEHPARQVEQDLPDAPAAGAPVAPVGQQLGRVLDEGDDDLDVPGRVDDVERAPPGRRVEVRVAGAEDDETDGGDADEAARADAEGEAARSGAEAGLEPPQGAGGEVLRRGDGAEGEAVQSEGYVVELDGRGEAGVAGGVLGADGGGGVEGEVGGEVSGEALSFASAGVIRIQETCVKGKSQVAT